MNKVIFLLIGTLIMGCQSHKPTVPKGSWSDINAIGFIPPNVQIYGAEIRANPSQIVEYRDAKTVRQEAKALKRQQREKKAQEAKEAKILREKQKEEQKLLKKEQKRQEKEAKRQAKGQ